MRALTSTGAEATLGRPRARSSGDRARASGARGRRFESCRAHDLTDVALFLHVLGALLFFSGAAVAGAASESAGRRRDVREIAVVLGVTRIGVALVGAGGLLVFLCGLWLVHLTHTSFGAAWVQAAIALFVVAAALGGIGGRKPRHARELARDGGPLDEVLRLLDDPWSRMANYASTALVLAILALMVWQPT